MAPPGPGVRVHLTQRCDMRKGIDGLAAQVQNVLAANPFSGRCSSFAGWRGDILKILAWDGSGPCLFAKRLEQGKFEPGSPRSLRASTGAAPVASPVPKRPFPILSIVMGKGGAIVSDERAFPPISRTSAAFGPVAPALSAATGDQASHAARHRVIPFRRRSRHELKRKDFRRSNHAQVVVPTESVSIVQARSAMGRH
jgi:hypothetical protein